MQNLLHRPDGDKRFPAVPESERAILGVLLLHPEQVPRAVESDLQTAHFFAPHHGAIYAAILALHKDGQQVGIEAVHARMSVLGTVGKLAAHDGIAYLIRLTSALESPAGLTDHIEAVKRAAVEGRQAIVREELRRSDISPDKRAALAAELATLSAAHDALLSAAKGWPGEPGPPLPLDDTSLPTWPAGALPAPFDEYVDAVADFVQVPRDLAGMVCLGTLAACWAGKVRVSPYEGYTEPLSLYCVAAADVGERKSATYAKFEQPIRAYEAELREALAPLHSDYAAEKAGLEAELQHALQHRRGSKQGDDGRADEKARARDLRRQLDALRPPLRAEFLTQDCTAEGLARLMSTTGGFACLMNPEGGGVFDILAGRYSELPNLDVFLKSFDAERLVVHRAQREREFPPIESPALVMAITTQPSTLRRLAERPELNERGLVARMLFAMPTGSRVGYREAWRPPIDPSLTDAYQQAVLQALRVERPATPHDLVFGPEALAEYRALHTRNEPRLRPDGDLHPMRSWACKLAGKIVRIAALFHLTDRRRDAEPWATPVSGETFQRAARLVEYLIAHAGRALSLMSQPPHLDAARKLLAAMERETRPRFSFRDAHRVVNRSASKDKIRPVLDLLADRNFIARSPGHRRDSELWIVNPHTVRSWQPPPGQSGHSDGCRR